MSSSRNENPCEGVSPVKFKSQETENFNDENNLIDSDTKIKSNFTNKSLKKLSFNKINKYMDKLDNLNGARDRIKKHNFEHNPDFKKTIMTVLKKANKDAVS